MTFKEAERILQEELRTAVWLEERTRTGERYLCLPDIGYCLIIKRDGRDLIAVTCVARENEDDGSLSDEEMQALLDYVPNGTDG